MSFSTHIASALRILIVLSLLLVGIGCASEPDFQPTPLAEAIASELVTVDEGVVLEDADFEEYDLDDEYETADLTGTTRPPDMCGRQECPRYSHLCCVGHCVRRVEGIRCVDRGGGVRE